MSRDSRDYRVVKIDDLCTAIESAIYDLESGIGNRIIVERLLSVLIANPREEQKWPEDHTKWPFFIKRAEATKRRK